MMSLLKLTMKEIESVRHTREQLRSWGVEWPPRHGWKKALVRGDDPNAPRVVDDWDAEVERLKMKAIYQDRSGDYSY
jgi:hypothetical protein